MRYPHRRRVRKMEATYQFIAVEAAKIGRRPLSLLIAKIEELTAIVNTLTDTRGLLAYTQVGDKFWYSEADIKKFLSLIIFLLLQ